MTAAASRCGNSAPGPRPTERDLLLAAVLADPDDDAIRLVYADWLEEYDRSPGLLDVMRRQQADPAWEGWKTADGTHCPWFLRRTADLCELFHAAARGMDDLDVPNMIGVGVRLGFVTELAVTRRQWLTHGTEAVRRWPVRRVVLSDLGMQVTDRFCVVGRADVTKPDWNEWGSSGQEQDRVRREWWALLCGPAGASSHYLYFPSRDAALAAASRAALLWARKEAGTCP